MSFKLPRDLEKFRDRLEATIKPYVEIQTRITNEASLWQSKIAGFPYLPKSVDYPKTPEGEYLYLLAQINFAEVPDLENFPKKGILQFYIAENELYGMDFDNPTKQAGFRVLYFPDPAPIEDNLVTDFDFLPTLWDRNFTSVPFDVFPSCIPDRGDCFALSFEQKFAPMSTSDYKFEELMGQDFLNILQSNNYHLWDEYSKFEIGHKLGGYPFFTQDDPRKLLSEDEEPYILLLQIDSDNVMDKIYILWGDCGVCNFFIQESALKQLDFSSVWYNWDCG